MFEESATHEIAAAASEAKGPSRRQLVKAGIWAAPVVVLATASPAAAVSVTSVSLSSAITATGTNSRTYRLTLTINGTNSNTAVNITPVTSAQAGVTVTWDTVDAFPASTMTAGTFYATVTVSGADKKTATIYVEVGTFETAPVTVSRS